MADSTAETAHPSGPPGKAQRERYALGHRAEGTHQVTLGAHSPLSRRTGSQSYTRPRGTYRRGRPPKFSAGAPPVLATGRTS